jgi:hypothetical protein
LKPKRLAADSAYGSAPTLDWLVNQKEIEPQIPVIDMERRNDGIFSGEDISDDKARDAGASSNPKLGTRKVDVAAMYNTERYGPITRCRRGGKSAA